MPETHTESPVLLTSRFNAHLTFNVLSTVQGLILEKDADTALELIGCYSRILRKMLINGRTEVTVKEELDVIRDYLEIERIRKDNGFSYSIDVDPSIFLLKLPKSFLVSLVENAIKHGNRKLDGGGWIRITGGNENWAGRISTGGGVIIIRNLAPGRDYGFDQFPDSVHGNDLLEGLREAYEEMTGREVSSVISENKTIDGLVEVEVLVSLR